MSEEFYEIFKELENAMREDAENIEKLVESLKEAFDSAVDEIFSKNPKYKIVLKLGCKPRTKIETSRIYYRCRNNC